MNRVIKFSERITVKSYAAVVGKKESEGPLGKYFDVRLTDDKFGEQTWEQAESKMLKTAVAKALEKGRVSEKDVNLIFAGDLLNQCIGSNYGLRDFNIPFMGLYGACSTMSEAIIAAGIGIESGAAEKCVAVTSSHFCSAERQFRFPLEYGGQRPPYSQWTVTGSGALVLEKGGSNHIRLKQCMVGRIVDMGITDMGNMGAAMAPAAYESLKEYFFASDTIPSDYDLIVTGDLGNVGSELMYELFEKDGVILKNNHADCGIEIYDLEKQDVHSGGSGCGCSASVLCGHILPLMERGRYENILFCATGALMSTVSSQQGETIPGICHVVNFVREG